jgi:uncharacterized protein YjbI with pentapeptide repeats
MDILHKYTKAVLYHSDLLNIKATLEEAVKSGADLGGADLGGADLHGAYLGGANLGGAKGINKLLTTALYFMRDQPGKIRAYKLVNEKYESPIYDKKLLYKIGETISEESNTDESEQCAAGISLATLDWILKEWKPGYRILVAEFEAADIAAIPVGSDGKFRVHRCTIIAEKPLSECGEGPWNPTNESTASAEIKS